MNLFLNAIILIFETIYYSLFMKSINEKSSLKKLFFMFLIINILFFIIGSTTLFSYLLLIIIILLGLKYFVKDKPTLYDMFFIFLMMIYKVVIESLFVIFIYIITTNAYYIALFLGVVKIIVTILTKNIINKVYFKLKVYWYQNRFFIRYIFDIIMFVYIIVSCIFLVLNRMGV